MELEELIYRLCSDSSFATELWRDPQRTLEKEGCDPSDPEMEALLSTIGRWRAAPGKAMIGPMLDWYGPVKGASRIPQLDWYGPAKHADRVPQLDWYGPVKGVDRIPQLDWYGPTKAVSRVPQLDWYTPEKQPQEV